MASCPFCQIVDGDRDANILCRDARTVAFFDRNPAGRGHTLVIPKPHHGFLFTEDASRSTAVFRAVRKVARALNGAMDPDGISVFYTSADLVGSVTHAHVHIIPRFADDDIRLGLARGSLDDEEAERRASRIREHV